MKLLRCSFVKPLFEGSLSRLTSPSSAYYAWPATFAPPRYPPGAIYCASELVQRRLSYVGGRPGTAVRGVERVAR